MNLYPKFAGKWPDLPWDPGPGLRIQVADAASTHPSLTRLELNYNDMKEREPEKSITLW